MKRQVTSHKAIPFTLSLPVEYESEHWSGQGYYEDVAPDRDACKAGRQFGTPQGFVLGKKQAGHTLDKSPGHEAAGRQLFCRPVIGLQSQPARHTAVRPWHKAPHRPGPLQSPAIPKETNNEFKKVTVHKIII